MLTSQLMALPTSLGDTVEDRFVMADVISDDLAEIISRVWKSDRRVTEIAGSMKS